MCIVGNVIKLQLDVNHDGVMDTSFAGPDNTSYARPMEFWVNDDSDAMTYAGDPGEDIENSDPTFYDCNSTTVPSERDLEDWARLWICGLPALPESQGYSVTLSLSAISGNPSINLMDALETNGGTLYLADTNTGHAQTFYTYGGHRAKYPTISPASPLALPGDLFTNAGTKYFLFEGAGVGEGQLTLTISQNNNVLAQTSAYIDLHDIKDFYERAVLTNDTSGAISNWTSGIELVQHATASALGDDTDLIVFVHGFNVGNWDWLNDSDTIFKRLYWAGYEGKFATVKWPAISISFSSFLSDGLYAFNWSELNADKASGAMASYLTQLRGRLPNYRLNILAHSQGNAVVSEAIEQGAPFDTYILTQGALPANSYDVNATNDPDLLSPELLYPTPEWEPLGYHGAYTNLTGNVVNFFNPNDAALADWLSDQKYLKPNPDYSYDGTNCWYNEGGNGAYKVTDMQESHALISRSRSLAIGQQGLSPGEAKEGIISSMVNLNSQFGFNDTIPDHSAEWTRPIQTSHLYYTELLLQIQPAP